MDRLEESSTQQNHKKVIDLDKLSRTTQKVNKTGLIYLARIPVGMGPGKVKHLLSKWGTVNRIYLARHEEAKTIKVKKGKEKHQSYQFKEGWIEFEDKRVARRVAELLNTRPIGGKASDRYSSELWSLKYLPKFKWSNLSDQMAVERRLREQLQRNSLEDSKKDQDWYLRMVEKNRVGNKIKEKEISRKGKVVNSTRWAPKEHKQRNIRASDTHGETNQQTSTGSRSNTDGMKTVLSNLL
ncbi:uncharacterized protein MELLADRAFT_40550 [Melampsora larici-populina 98AG31]|uniref:18S rRNA factor 2 n=1 Tax=Melampsora larici-populina (strain 98AG31 / pathotype 3-4-7) TaxID=747676 RepID=F4S8R8_MELLP|nr:uncharacterized protein MELLADRAFT_40550 [Melampsora larici-populina 98AG31]EGF98978.1 hypothetical protein MELLADRAFT_40550 [Melampsora larici-populina 98AG31]